MTPVFLYWRSVAPHWVVERGDHKVYVERVLIFVPGYTSPHRCESDVTGFPDLLRLDVLRFDGDVTIVVEDFPGGQMVRLVPGAYGRALNKLAAELGRKHGGNN